MDLLKTREILLSSWTSRGRLPTIHVSHLLFFPPNVLQLHVDCLHFPFESEQFCVNSVQVIPLCHRFPVCSIGSILPKKSDPRILSNVVICSNHSVVSSRAHMSCMSLLLIAMHIALYRILTFCRETYFILSFFHVGNRKSAAK